MNSSLSQNRQDRHAVEPVRLFESTIVIPAYNRERFIRKAVESALGQSLPPVEVLVVDDGSTDGTAEAVAGLDRRVRLIRIENNGAGPSRPRNVGIDAAATQYVTVLDSDDLLHPELLRRHHELLTRAPGVGLVSHGFTRQSAAGAPVPSNCRASHHRSSYVDLGSGLRMYPQREAYTAMCRGNFLPGSGATFPKQVWETVGGYDETLRNSNDYDFYLRVLRRFDLGYVDEALSVYVLHEGNISAADQSGVFKPYRPVNQMRVLDRELRLNTDRRVRAALKRRARTVLSDMAYGYRTLGQHAQSVRASLRSLRYGASPLRVGVELSKAAVEAAACRCGLRSRMEHGTAFVPPAQAKPDLQP